MTEWKNFREFNTIHKEALIDTSKPSSGPYTDSFFTSRLQNQNDVSMNTHRCWNHNAFQEYFTNEIVRESFLLYINCLFADCSPEILCKRFNFRCCSLERHLPECMGQWEKFRRCLQTDLFIDYA